RTLIARQSSSYIGYFKLVDPLYLWQGTGQGVLVTLLGDVRGARVEHNHSNDGSYLNSTVRIKVGDEKIELTVKGMERAEQVMAFAEGLAELSDLAPIDRGYQAKGIAEEDTEEMLERVEALARGEVLAARVRDERRRREEHREVDEIPEPHKVRTSISALW